MKVYLIRNSEGHYKIGRTKLTTTKRIKQLQTGSSSEIELVTECEVENSSKVESTLHNRYRAFNVSGEWFALPLEEVKKFKNIVSQIDSSFKLLRESGNPFI